MSNIVDIELTDVAEATPKQVGEYVRLVRTLNKFAAISPQICRTRAAFYLARLERAHSGNTGVLLLLKRVIRRANVPYTGEYWKEIQQ